MQRDFFRINMPYVIEKVDALDGKWVVLNRDYSPLGFLCAGLKWELFPKDYLRLGNITERKIEQLEKAGATIRRDEAGQVFRIVLYNDRSVPVNKYEEVTLDKPSWDAYSKLLAILATITRSKKEMLNKK